MIEIYIKELDNNDNFEYTTKNAEGRDPWLVANALLCVEIDYLCDTFGTDKQKAVATVFRGMAEQLMKLGMSTTLLHGFIEVIAAATNHSKDDE